MTPKALCVLAVFFLGGCASFSKAPPIQLNVTKLSTEHIAEVKNLVAKLEPFIQSKDLEGKLPWLTFTELASPLTAGEKRFLRRFRELKASEVRVSIPFRGFSEGQKDLVRLDNQRIRLKGKEIAIPPQFMSPRVYQSYQFMMLAMERDTGKRLFVESGYRPSAYQLYLFIFYLSTHDYSIRETAKWVALPGYSEHGDPEHSAIDFINSNGINGEYNVTEFEVLPEYQWLLKNAGRFGFVLSYPKNTAAGITYEPWHWCYDGAPLTPAILNAVPPWTKSSAPLSRLPFREQSQGVSSALRSSQREDLLSADRNRHTLPIIKNTLESSAAMISKNS